MASSYTFLSDDSSDSDTSLKAQGTGSDTDDELPAIDVSTPKKASLPTIHSVQPQPPVQACPAPIPSSISTPPRPTPPSPQKPHDGYTSRTTDCPSVQKTPERKLTGSYPSHSRSSLMLGASPSFSLSLNSLSPLRMGTDHARTVDEGRRLAMKAGKLSRNLKQKTETRQKIDCFKKMGGIRALSKDWEEHEHARSSASEGERESETLTPGPDSSPTSLVMFRKLSSTSAPPEAPPLPSLPPGKIIFTKAPSFITELYPPGLEIDTTGMFSGTQHNLLQITAGPETLKEAVLGGWIKLCYCDRPCPQALWQWLFQMMCRSDDAVLSNGAFRSLITLLQLALSRSDQASIHPPSMADIVEVLVCMGADQSRLDSSTTGAERMEVDESEDVFPPRVPTRSLSHLLKYLTHCIRVLPGCYTMGELEDLVILLLSVALEPQLLGQPIENDIMQCTGIALAVIPEESWMKAAKRLLSRILAIASHHHNQLYVAYLISGTSETDRQRFLQKLFCRESIAQILGLNSEVETKQASPVKVKTEETATVNGSARMSTSQPDDSNCQFAQKVISHYNHLSSVHYDYYRMYSVLTMLSRFMDPTDMKWPSQEKRQEFSRLLGCLSSNKIHDHPQHPERGPVKDLVIRMKLEVSGQKVAGQLKQTSLFAFQ